MIKIFNPLKTKQKTVIDAVSAQFSFRLSVQDELSSDFVRLVADFKSCLTYFREQAATQAVDLLKQEFIGSVTNHYQSIKAIWNQVSESDQSKYLAFLDTQIRPFLNPTSLFTQCLKMGLPQNYELESLLYIINRGYMAQDTWEMLLISWLVSSASGQAIFKRRQEIKKQIDHAVQNSQTRIMAYHCGPSFELLEYIADTDYPNDCEFYCVDSNPVLLNFIKETIALMRRKKKISMFYEWVENGQPSAFKADFMFSNNASSDFNS